MPGPAILLVAAILSATVALEALLRRRERIASSPAEPEAAGSDQSLTPEAYLEGPFRLCLEDCSSTEHPRVRARAMEHGRADFIAYLRSQADEGRDVAEIHGRARAMAVAWFSRPGAPDGDYMLEVFDGYSTHNYRGRPDPARAAPRSDPTD